MACFTFHRPKEQKKKFTVQQPDNYAKLSLFLFHMVKHILNSNFVSFRILVRSSSHIIEGLLPTSSICANKYSETEVVDALRRELKLTDHFKPFLDEQIEEKLCKLDRVCYRSLYFFFKGHGESERMWAIWLALVW